MDLDWRKTKKYKGYEHTIVEARDKRISEEDAKWARQHNKKQKRLADKIEGIISTKEQKRRAIRKFNKRKKRREEKAALANANAVK